MNPFKLRLALFICCVGISFSVMGQYEGISFTDTVYIPEIRSVKLQLGDNYKHLPILKLNGGSRLRLTFDDLVESVQDYSYRIIHCDRNWNPSDLDEVEYLYGFNNEEITDYEFSTNTFVDYVNYGLTIPNEELRPIISGNYLLVIYMGHEDDEDRIPAITRRFMVAEELASISVKPTKPSDVSKINSHYEFDFSVYTKDIYITDAKNEIFVDIYQNGRSDNAIRQLTPSFITGNKLYFNYTDKVVFPGFKEFRNFDIRSLEYAREFTNSLDLHNEGADVLLELGQVTAYSFYHTRPDANGQFVIDAENVDDPRVNGDYATVIFTLDSPPVNGELYVIGAFSDWNAMPQYRLQFDDYRKLYVGSALFKQGYYNYFFAVKDNQGNLDVESIEGSWQETENDYYLLVYFSEQASQFDRLIGTSIFNSN